MTFRLGTSSKARLALVHPHLRQLVERAILVTEIDFTVSEGIRTLERQRQLVAAGASQTLRSRHLTGHAVDLAPLLDGHVRWDWPLCFKVADAMRLASLELGIPIEWGGAWDRRLKDFDDAEHAQDDYLEARRKAGKRPFLDGPHFQLPWQDYPS